MQKEEKFSLLKQKAELVTESKLFDFLIPSLKLSSF